MKNINKYGIYLWVFVASGFAGLIYQSVWSHYLGLFLGHAAYAQVLVLSVFMGGMAIGAAIVAKMSWRWQDLIRIYAVAEFLIGVMGAAFHYIFVAVLDISYDALMPSLGEGGLVVAYRWLVCAVMILPQTVLLGMTFPLMSAGIIRRYPGSAGKTLGGLYFSNSIGAAAGVLIAAFFLLPYVGLNGALLVAAILNTLVGVTAWALSSYARGEEEYTAPQVDDSARNSNSPGSVKIRRLVLVATFLSGAASFAYEIVWIRMLGMAVGSTLQAFEIMLASFIAGIAFGGLWVRRFAKHSRPLKVVGWMQLFMGVSALCSLLFYAYAFEWVGFLHGALSKSDQGYLLYNVGTALIAILVMMPAAFFAGTTLPLFTMALLSDGQGESAIGNVYAWNTIGSIFGVILVVHWLIPGVGLKLALIAACAVDILLGVFLLRIHVGESLSKVKYSIASGSVVVALALFLIWLPFDPLKVSSGVFRHGNTSTQADKELLFYKDGKTASVAATVGKDGVVSIATNGKPDASISMYGLVAPTPDEPTMILAAAIPMAYIETPRQVGVIGFGSGLTTHTVLGDKRLDSVDTIEIEQAMVEGAKVFGARVARAYHDPRSNIIIDDAKSFFSTSSSNYDVLISEPSNPWISGVGSLFSKEFYKLIPRYLSDNGVFVQWLQLYEISDSNVGSVLSAMIPEFNDYHAYLANNADLLIVASMRDLGDADYSSLFYNGMAADLERAGFTEGQQVQFRKVADGRMLRALARLYPATPNSDYLPVLSLNAPKNRFKKDSANTLLHVVTHNLPIVEFLVGGRPLESDVLTGVPGHFERADLTREARTFVLSQQGEAGQISDQNIGLAYAWRDFRCRNEWSVLDIKYASELLVSTTNRTVAFLDDELSSKLLEGGVLACDSIPLPLAVLQQLARSAFLRDKAGIIGAASKWFEDHRVREYEYLTSRYDQFVLAWWQLLVATNRDTAEFERLEEAYGSKGASNKDYALANAVIAAWLDE